MVFQGNNVQTQQNQMRNANAAEQASMVSKCARFFKTLIHLSQQPDQQQGHQTAMRVTELVKVCFNIDLESVLSFIYFF